MIIRILTIFAIFISAYAGPEDKVLAKVDGESITNSEVEEFKKILGPNLKAMNKKGTDVDKNILSQLIDLKVLIRAAMKSGVDKKVDVQKAIAKATEQVVMNAFVVDQLKSKVNDVALEKAYKGFKENYQKEINGKKEMKLRHILLKTESDAKRVVKELKEGKDFQKLAREESVDKESGKNGGNLDYVLEGSLPDFNDSLGKIKTGSFSSMPVKSKLGYHVFKVDDRRKAQVPKFDKVKSHLRMKVQQEAVRDLVKKLRDASVINFMS